MSEGSPEDTTSRLRVSPREYFDELRIDLATEEWLQTLHELEHPGTPPPEARWPKIGRFECRNWQGSGGFGAVIIARDPDLDRLVALKLCPAVAREAEKKIKREAQLLAEFTHANIVTIHEFGRQGGDFFYVMEYFADGDAASMLEHEPTSAEIVETYCLAGDGLAAAHGGGVIHGDFKPSNVLVSKHDRRVCVADFGLARRLGECDEPAEPGSSSYRAGTLRYMAPELLVGGAVTELTDQWAFCVALWESLFRRPPFVGHDAQTMLASIQRGLEPPMLRLGPTANIVKALRRGLSIDPGDRHPNMSSLVLTLRSAMGIVPGGRSRRGRHVYPLAVALTLAVGLGLAWKYRRPPSSLAEAPSQRPPPSEAVAQASPCALFDPDESVTEVVVDRDVLAVCELIRLNLFEQAKKLWDKSDNDRFTTLQSNGKANPEAVRYVEDTLIIVRTFVDQAEQCAAADDDDGARAAAEYARGDLNFVEAALGADRIKSVSERLEPFAPK